MSCGLTQSPSTADLLPFFGRWREHLFFQPRLQSSAFELATMEKRFAFSEELPCSCPSLLTSLLPSLGLLDSHFPLFHLPLCWDRPSGIPSGAFTEPNLPKFKQIEPEGQSQKAWHTEHMFLKCGRSPSAALWTCAKRRNGVGGGGSGSPVILKTEAWGGSSRVSLGS